MATNTLPLWTTKLFFNKMGHAPPLFHLFLSFQTNITILSTNTCEVWPYSMPHYWESNPLASEPESPPITTRPGLPPNNKAVSNYNSTSSELSLLHYNYLLRINPESNIRSSWLQIYCFIQNLSNPFSCVTCRWIIFFISLNTRLDYC